MVSFSPMAAISSWASEGNHRSKVSGISKRKKKFFHFKQLTEREMRKIGIHCDLEETCKTFKNKILLKKEKTKLTFSHGDDDSSPLIFALILGSIWRDR